MFKEAVQRKLLTSSKGKAVQQKREDIRIEIKISFRKGMEYNDEEKTVAGIIFSAFYGRRQCDRSRLRFCGRQYLF